jgi:3-isopropylmalate/(R)-2-methylmalate dehydratase large subunit
MTLFDKLWQDHLVTNLEDGNSLIAIDRILIHERTGAIALHGLESMGRPVVLPKHVFCTIDHIVDTMPGRPNTARMPGGEVFIDALRESARSAGLTLFDIDDPNQGIVHVIAPELGIALPGLSIICPDSHTCTLGALGALAWGIGSTEAEHALATGTLKIRKPQTMRVCFDGNLTAGVTAKDMMLHLISEHSASGGNGYAIEFAGDAVSALSMAGRMTLCNMAVEFGASTGLIAPDEHTIAYVAQRPFGVVEEFQIAASDYWRQLRSGPEEKFDATIRIRADDIRPMVTWGTSPEHAVPLGAVVPDIAKQNRADSGTSIDRAMEYMDVLPDTNISDLEIDGAFIGSCTNSRLEDLRKVAAVLKGRRVADGVKAICVPGSTQTKLAAEAEGLDRSEGDRVVSSTNRNFEGRQGPGVRTHLASPETVAASAIAGRIVTAVSGKED